jgi:hypothetical protein
MKKSISIEFGVNERALANEIEAGTGLLPSSIIIDEQGAGLFFLVINATGAPNLENWEDLTRKISEIVSKHLPKTIELKTRYTNYHAEFAVGQEARYEIKIPGGLAWNDK